MLCLSIEYGVCDIFFFNDTATTEIYTLSLHDALPILCHDHTSNDSTLANKAQTQSTFIRAHNYETNAADFNELSEAEKDRKSTRLNSSHSQISYAVFCLKKKQLGCIY